MNFTLIYIVTNYVTACLLLLFYAGALIKVQLGSRYLMLFQLIGLLMISNVGALIMAFEN